MKKVFVSLMLMLAVVSGVSAQSWKDLLGKAASEVAGKVSSNDTGSAVTNILGTLLGNSLTLSNSLLEGTWSYEGVACILESENALSNVGGSLVAGNLESKLDDMLTKVGVSKGKCSFTFVKDGNCTINLGGYNLSGKYELNASEKVINFSFVFDKVPVKTYVAYELQNLNVVFKADKLLALIKDIASYISTQDTSSEQQSQLQSLTQAVGAFGSLLKNYDGLMLGVKLTKSATTAAGTSTGNSTKTSDSGSKLSLGNLFK